MQFNRLLAIRSLGTSWLLFAVVAVIGAIALLVLILLMRLGGEDEIDIDALLAAVPGVGLESYVGEAEYSASYRYEILDTPRDIEMEGLIEIWFEAPERLRFEMESFRAEGENAGRQVWVSDGKALWTYDERSHTFDRRPLPDLRPADDEAVGPFELLLFPGVFRFEQAFADMLSEDPPGVISLRDGESVLGREVYMLKGESADAVLRLWLDKEYLLPLRMELGSGSEGNVFDFRFTSIELDVDIDDAVFQFTPPPGAVRDNVRRVRQWLKPGMLAPTWLPQDYGFAGGHGGSGGSQYGVTRLEAEARLRSDDRGGVLTIKEELSREGLADSLKRGTKIEIRGQDAWIEHRDDGTTVLVWKEGDFVITVTADQLSADDLLRLAESMELVLEEDEVETVPAFPDSPVVTE